MPWESQSYQESPRVGFIQSITEVWSRTLGLKVTKASCSQQRKQSLSGTICLIFISTPKIKPPQLVVGGAAEGSLPELSNSCQQFVHLFSGSQMLISVFRVLSWPATPLPMSHPTNLVERPVVVVRESRVSISDHWLATDGKVSRLLCSPQVTEATAVSPVQFWRKNCVHYIKNTWNIWFIVHQGNISAVQ